MKRDGREAFSFFPHNRGSMRTYLYAIGYVDGRTKIGVSYHPRDRLIQHWRQRSCELAWVHLFGPSLRSIESRALQLAAKHGERIESTEVFRSLPRDVALRCVRQAIAEAA